MKTPTLTGSLKYASGEELLLLTIFQPRIKRTIGRELDRRAALRRHAMRIAPTSTMKRAA
jgi:hypothetical protein